MVPTCTTAKATSWSAPARRFEARGAFAIALLGDSERPPARRPATPIRAAGPRCFLLRLHGYAGRTERPDDHGVADGVIGPVEAPVHHDVAGGGAGVRVGDERGVAVVRAQDVEAVREQRPTV